jgi:hypothetical protein
MRGTLWEATRTNIDLDQSLDSFSQKDKTCKGGSVDFNDGVEKE